MGRENFMIKLTQAGTNYPEYVMLGGIARMVEVPAKKTKDGEAPACTHVYLAGQAEPIAVVESVESIEQQCKKIANLMYVVRK